MKYISLKKSKAKRSISDNHKIVPITKSLPFIEAFRGCFAHRVRYGDIAAYVVSPQRMKELLDAEAQKNEYLKTLADLQGGKLHIDDLINL